MLVLCMHAKIHSGFSCVAENVNLKTEKRGFYCVYAYINTALYMKITLNH